MRPIALTLSGFTSFSEEQHVDFTGLDVFAIGGATGSGKSSLLDAMVFALYAQVPRLSPQQRSNLISVGRDRLHVLFDFAVRDRRLRVVRTMSAGPATAVLERLSPGKERPHVRKRLLRRRQADALERPLRQRLEPLERQGEVRAPFVPDEGMDLVDDHGAHRPQGLSTARRRQEYVQ